MISGSLSRVASSTARVNFSPTTEPMLPPMKAKSNRQSATRFPLIWPSPMTIASL